MQLNLCCGILLDSLQKTWYNAANEQERMNVMAPETYARLRRPSLIRTSTGDAASLADALVIEHVTSLVGSGGKTSTMLALAGELCGRGARVIVTTTTHMWPVAEPLPIGLRVVGVPGKLGKLGPVERPEALIRECDYLLIEADGSRGLPAKAPSGHEPVILRETELVIGVQGLTAFGNPIGKVCHRPEQVCALLGRGPEDLLTAQDMARLLTLPMGLRKNVGERRYAAVLNQADGPVQLRAAEAITGFLPGEIPWAVTAYSCKEIDK